MKIKVTEFATKHFDKKFGGTKILDYTVEQFENEINNSDVGFCLENHGTPHGALNNVKVHDGYAPFCKLLAIKNFTDARVGTLPITLENYQYLRSGYSARRDSELPIFSRWFELPLGKPKADWLVMVLYSREQLHKEALIEYEKKVKLFTEGKLKENPVCEPIIDGDYGIVAILGQLHPNEEPMKPETMIRNAGYNTEEFQKKAIEEIVKIFDSQQENHGDVPPLADAEGDFKDILSLQGTMVGGSGVPINEEKYLQSVEFWSNNATVK